MLHPVEVEADVAEVAHEIFTRQQQLAGAYVAEPLQASIGSVVAVRIASVLRLTSIAREEGMGALVTDRESSATRRVATAYLDHDSVTTAQEAAGKV
ncbi:MAG TPA: hypothetical protein VN927_03295, partial [Gemmatimonadaceae bacterium]|nr:hypothetical protein [Gemmatimonadaceae bacterium]